MVSTTDTWTAGADAPTAVRAARQPGSKLGAGYVAAIAPLRSSTRPSEPPSMVGSPACSGRLSLAQSGHAAAGVMWACIPGCLHVVAEQQGGGRGGSGEPGEGYEQRAGLAEAGGQDCVGEDAEAAVAGQEVCPGRRGRAEHGVLGDAQVEERDQEGDQDPGDPAEQRGEDYPDHGVGEGEDDAGGDVAPPLADAGYGGGHREGHRGGEQGG